MRIALLTLILICLCFCTGCATFDYGDVHYARLGNQSLKAEVTDPNGYTVKLEQKADLVGLAEIITAAVTAVVIF